jgi:hypothetical protein
MRPWRLSEPRRARSASQPARYRPFAQREDRDVVFFEELLDPLLAGLALVGAARIRVQVVRVELERDEPERRQRRHLRPRPPSTPRIASVACSRNAFPGALELDSSSSSGTRQSYGCLADQASADSAAWPGQRACRSSRRVEQYATATASAAAKVSIV